MNKRKELSRNVTEYLYEVVFDVLYFLNEKMDSNKEEETWYSDLEYPRRTSLGSLYDDDQYLWFYGLGQDVHIHLLDNNKLLLIYEENNDDGLRTFFDFSLISNASDYVLRTIKEKSGKLTFELNDKKGNMLRFPESDSYYPKEFPEEERVIGLIRPISFKQLYKRGHINKEKEKVKQNVKK